MAFGQQGQQGFQNPSVITANQIISIKGGFLGYNPSKAHNNLIVSMNPGPAFLDGFNNQVLPGVVNYYTAAGTPYTAIQFYQGAVNWYTATDESNWTLITQILAWQNSGNAGIWFPSWPAVGKRLWIGGVIGNPTPTFPLILVQPINAGDLILGTLLFSDSQNRWQIDSTGKQSWGDGTHAVDTDLYRILDPTSSVPVLKTDNEFNAGSLNIPSNIAGAHFGVDGNGLIYLIGPSGSPTGIRALAQVSSDTTNRWQMDANGLQSWGPGGSSAVDASLQRVLAAVMQFNNHLEINSSLFLQLVSSPPLVPSGYLGFWADTFGIGHVQNSWVIDGVNNFLQISNATSAPPTVPGGIRIVGSGANLPFMVGGSGQGWFLQAGTQQDGTGAHTVATSTFQQISGTWTIDAADASLNDIYKLELRGHGTQGSTAQALTLAAFGTGNVTINAANLPANTGFAWSFTAELFIKSTGAGGTCDLITKLEVSNGTSGIYAAAIASNRSVAINTTVGNNFVAQAAWGTITGAPTITCDENWLEKIA